MSSLQNVIICSILFNNKGDVILNSLNNLLQIFQMCMCMFFILQLTNWKFTEAKLLLPRCAAGKTSELWFSCLSNGFSSISVNALCMKNRVLFLFYNDLQTCKTKYEQGFSCFHRISAENGGWQILTESVKFSDCPRQQSKDDKDLLKFSLKYIENIYVCECLWVYEWLFLLPHPGWETLPWLLPKEF